MFKCCYDDPKPSPNTFSHISMLYSHYIHNTATFRYHVNDVLLRIRVFIYLCGFSMVEQFEAPQKFPI